MARGVDESVLDGLVRMVQDIAKMKIAPDADQEATQFLDQLQGLIYDWIRGAPQGGGGRRPPAPEEPMDLPERGQPVPGVMPGMDMAGAVQDLERQLAG